METVTLSEFVNLSRLTERDVIRMLDLGELRTVSGPNGEVLVDLTTVTPELLAKRCDSGISEDSADIEEEIVASEILSALDEIIEESLEMALRWQAEKEAGDSDTDE